MKASASMTPIQKTVFFYFGGTGSPVWFRGGSGGPQCLRQFKYEHTFTMHADCLRIYFEGCHDPRIGGRYMGLGNIDPNLDVIARKLRSAFDPDDDSSAAETKHLLSIGKLKRLFGNAIRIEPRGAVDDDTLVDVTKIVMSGYSRGGVTCSAAARLLGDLAIPMVAFAQDPVPGNTRRQADQADSEYAKNASLDDIDALEEFVVSVGTYRRDLFLPQNIFFRQMMSRTQEGRYRYFKTNRPHHLAMTDDIVRAEFEAFLHKHGVVSELRKQNPRLARTRVTPLPDVLLHNLHGDTGHFNQVSYSDTHRKVVRGEIKDRVLTPADSISDTQLMACYAVSRRYDTEEDTPDGLLISIDDKPAVARVIEQLDAIARLHMETKRPSQRTQTIIHACLCDMDRLLLNVTRHGEQLSKLAFYHRARQHFQAMLARLPLAYHGNMLDTLRKELSLNRLGLAEPTEADLATVRRKSKDFSGWVSGAVLTTTLGTSGGAYVGFLLATCSQANQLMYALVLSAVVVATLAAVVAFSCEADKNHPRHWTLCEKTPARYTAKQIELT